MSEATQKQFELVQKYMDILMSDDQDISGTDIKKMYENGELIDAPQELLEKYLGGFSNGIAMVFEPLLSINGMEVAIPFIIRTFGMFIGMTASIFYHIGTLDESRIVEEKIKTIMSAVNSIECSECGTNEDN